MIIVSFYSYKGGTGRTTMLANVAYQLAAMGRKVLCVDFDIDGPGLLHVLQLSMAAVRQQNIISLLSYDREIEESDRLLDVRRHRIPWEQTVGGHVITFDCIPAPMGTERQSIFDHYSGEDLAKRVMELCSQAEKDEGYDFLLIDSSAGFDTFTSLSFAAADLSLVCFRWSEQHIQGTLEASYLLGAMLRRNYEVIHKGAARAFPLKDFWLVASGVPTPRTEFQRERQTSVESELTGEIGRIRSEAGVASYQEGITKISEDDDLKWFEEIIVASSRPAFDEFRRLAVMLDKFHEQYGDLDIHSSDDFD